MFCEASFCGRFSVTVVSIVMTRLALNAQTLPFRTDCLVAGTTCRVSTNSPDILRAAAQWQPQRKSASIASFEMEILVNAARASHPLESPHFRGLRHLVFVALPPENFIVYDLLRKRAHAVLSDSTACDTSFWNRLLLPITFGVLGTTVGLVPLHCACLERKDAGFLLAGVSGAGKSTLSAALAHRAFAFISDDWTYVAKRESGLIGHGLCSPIKLLPDAARFFPHLQDFAPGPTLNGELAYEIDPRGSSGITVKTFSYPQRLFFLERTPNPGCEFIVCPTGYVKAYFEQSAERLPDEVPAAKQFRASVIERLSMYPAWILRTGYGPQRTAEAVDDFLSEVAHAIA
jgi:hypothetical protein